MVRQILLALLLTLVAGLALAQSAEPVETIRTAPVVLDGHTLYEVRGTSAITPEERAAGIRRNLLSAAEDPAFDPAAMTLLPIEGGVELRAGDRIIRGIYDADARLEGVETSVLANSVRVRTAWGIDTWRADRSAEGVARALRRVGIATAAFLAVLLGVWALDRAADRLIHRHVEGRIADWERRARDVVRLQALWHGARRTLRGAIAALGLAAVLVYLDVVLLALPWTRDAGRRLGALAADPLLNLGRSMLGAIPELIVLALIVTLTWQATRLVTRFFAAVGSGRLRVHGFDRDWARPTARIVRAAVVLLGLVMAYPYIPGSSSEAFKAISIFAGVVLSLGATSMIANVVAGNSLIYRRAFRVGDRVEIAGVLGDVEELTAQATYLRTLKNVRVTLPNALVLGSQVTNYTTLARSEGLILHAEVGIGYETPWREVEAMLLEAAARTEGLMASPAPFVLQKRLGDFAPVYEINAYTQDERAAQATLTRLLAAVQDVFAERGVQIMTPNYVADPAQAKIPPRPA